MSTRERRAALLSLLLATVIWGGVFPVNRAGVFAVRDVMAREGAGAQGDLWLAAPMLYLALRFTVATIAASLLPGAWRALLSGREALEDVLRVGAPFFLGFLLQYMGITETSATVAAFLTSAYVVIVPIIALAASREFPPGRLVAGALLSALGISALVGAYDAIARGEPLRFGRGEALTLACAVAFAYQVHAIARAARRTAPQALTLGTMLLAAVLAVGIVACTRGGRAAMSPSVLFSLASDRVVAGAVLYSALAASVLAVQIMYRYQNVVSPSRAVILYALEPAFAAVFAWVFARESFGASAIAGCCLILLGNMVAELPRRGG